MNILTEFNNSYSFIVKISTNRPFIYKQSGFKCTITELKIDLLYNFQEVQIKLSIKSIGQLSVVRKQPISLSL